MAYSQIRDLVEMIRQFRRELAALCEEMSDEAADPQLKLLLDHVGHYEQNVNQALASYQEDDSSEALLNTWLQYTSTGELKRTLLGALDEVDDSEDLTPETLIEAMMKFDQRLLEFYRQGRDESSVPRVQEFFESLLQLEEGKQHDFAKSVLELRDGQ